MKRFVFVIPTAILVFFIAVWMLNKDYAVIDGGIRLLIAAGASVFSGIIAFFLMKNDAEQLTNAQKKQRKR